MSIRSLFTGFISTLLRCACGPTFIYEYAAPTSHDGRLCVSQCNNQRTSCTLMTQNQWNQCQANYNNIMTNYHQCVKAGGKYCVMPQACQGGSTWQCDEAYRGCFTSCGGHVTPHVVQDND